MDKFDRATALFYIHGICNKWKMICHEETTEQQRAKLISDQIELIIHLEKLIEKVGKND